MNGSTWARRGSTAQRREALRLTRSVVATLGREVKRSRRQAGLTQASLGDRLGVAQAWISRIELGHGEHAPLDTWIALGLVLKRPLAVSFSRALGEAREPADAGHLAMQERLLQLARAAGMNASFELHTKPGNPRHSIDVCVRNPRLRILVIQEAWNTFGDVGEAIRSTNRKTAEATDLAATIDGGAPYRIATAWIVRPTAANRALLRRYPEIFSSAFPGSSRHWSAALMTGIVPPDQSGLVWLDPASGRISEWRRTG